MGQRGDRWDRGFTLQKIRCWTSSVMAFRLRGRQRLWGVHGEGLQQVLNAVTAAQLHNNNVRKTLKTVRLCVFEAANRPAAAEGPPSRSSGSGLWTT